MQYEPYAYQQRAEEFIIEHDASALFLDMGLGKTVITLSALLTLLTLGEIRRVLVIAPLLPARETWPAEIEKWSHTNDMCYSVAIGSEKDRLEALAKSTDIVIINRENVVWLVDHYRQKWPFDCVVIDELSSFKNPGAKRFRALKRVRKYITRIVGLTGTPAPNGLLDLWSQVYLLDQGERLGRTLTGYREHYFTPDRWGPAGVVFSWRLKEGAEKRIHERIADICISMDKADDLPEMVSVERPVFLPPAVLAQYKRLERDLFLTIPDGEIDAVNAAVLAGKLLQYAGGAVYDTDGGVIKLHDEKLLALDQLIEEANGQSVLVFYNYKHELARLSERYPEAVHIQEPEAVSRWNAGGIPILLANPASAGHGLNLQHGGHIIVWFSLTWNLEYYEQANKRLHRRGQDKPVLIHHLISQGTIDEEILHIVLQDKKHTQDALLRAVKARR